MTATIPLDPALPADFDDTPNEERTPEQLDKFWDKPYGITQPDGRILVRCLNGGAWDRSTVFGIAENFEEACKLAEEKQASWEKMRSAPTFYFSSEPPYRLIVQAQRPDREPVVFGEYPTMDELMTALKPFQD